ncbi:hypothetical protein DEO72_LG8g1230 [Vigna unguiculata]|uniref:Uncharacterized protein n=1 Tax=Vigna unguiculata TaxID=3917 RepID=A0A4D6MQA2_VIGUN|nr:hypothetical protein DEO72_LG8g1230 [Vigna unguiculata]
MASQRSKAKRIKMTARKLVHEARLKELLSYQGLDYSIQLKGTVYPNFVKVFYANAHIEDDLLISRVNGIDTVLTNDGEQSCPTQHKGHISNACYQRKNPEQRGNVWMFKDDLSEDEEDTFEPVNIYLFGVAARMKTNNEFQRYVLRLLWTNHCIYMSKFDLLHKEIVDIKKQLVDCNLGGSSNNPNEEDSKDFTTSNDASEDEKDV